MYRLKLRVIFLFAIIFSPYFSFSQKTLVDDDPMMLFRKAVELYENQKYAAAIETFDAYIRTKKSYLLNGTSMYMAAMSAKNIDLKSTESLFADYLDKYPEQNATQDVYFQLGKYTFDNKKYDRTSYWLKKISKPKYFDIPKAQEYFFMLGYSSYKTENYVDAMKAFSELDSYENPYFNTANYYNGYIYYKQDKFSEALENFLRVQNIQKLSEIVPVYITHIYLRLGDYKNTIEYGQKALQKDNIQKRTDILRYMAQAYFRLNNYAKTIEIFSMLEEKNNSFREDELYCYGYSLFYEKQYSKAINYLSEINPSENAFGQNVSYNLAMAYQKTDDNLKARNLYSFAMKLDFDTFIQEQSYFNYAKISYQLNFQKEAISTLRDFIRIFPNSPKSNDAKTLLSQLLLASNNYKEALEILEAIPDKSPDIKNMYQQVNYFYALDLYRNKKYDEAKEKFNISISNDVNPKYTALSYFWLGECFYAMGNMDDAIKNYHDFVLKDAARSTPYYSLGYYSMGYAFFKTEKYKDAHSAFMKFTELEDNSKHTERYYDGILRLGDCDLTLKEYEKALENYDVIIDNGYQDIDYALYQKATIMGLKNKNDEKSSILNIIIQKYPKSPYVDNAYYEIANVFFLESKFSSALSKFSVFAQKFPKSRYYTSTLLKIGLCYYNLEENDKAIEQFKMLIKEFPYTPEAKEALSAVSNIYTEDGKGEELIKYLKSVPNLQLTASFEDSAMYTAAFSYIKKNNCEEATKAMDSYLKSFPKGYFAVNANYYLANCALYLSYKDVALEHFEVINELGFNEFYEKSLKNAADLFFNYKKDFPNALKRYKQLEETSGNKDNTLIAVAGQMRCYNKTGEYEQSRIYAEKLLSLQNVSPDDKTEAQYCIGIAQYQAKSYDLALAMFKLVSENNKSDIGAEAKYLTANVYYLQEKYDDAVKTILVLKDNFSNSDYFVAKGFILLSDIFVKTGDLFQARRTLESITKNCTYNDLVAIANQKLQNITLLEQQKIKPDSNKVGTDSLMIKQEDIK